MNWYKYILPLLFIFSFNLKAQHLRVLQQNQVIKKFKSERPYLLKSSSSLVLDVPFLEDFSDHSVFPDPNKWSDKYVFINNSFAIDPISIGVATLDGIDQNGNVYAMTNWPTSSDTLTSLDFDLSPYANTDDTVRLSFFYQCGGKGETPEIKDSLVLELYYPLTDKWTRSWFAVNDTVTDFEQEILVIPDTCYVNGFRFRFRNYTSLSVNEVSGGAGALSNADCWNIDYIMMNTDPEVDHRWINDVTLTDLPRRLLDYYEAIPWRHLNDAQDIVRNLINWDIRILNFAGEENIGRSYYMRDLNTGDIFDADVQSEPFNPGLHRRYEFFGLALTNNNLYKEGKFEVASFLDTPGDQLKSNDTSKITLHFKDAYIYDDGSPEYGFGIEGPSMYGALLALRFRVYKPDTLQGLDLLFNKARDNFNAHLKFQLCVWKDNAGIPGDLIYISPEYQPKLDSEIPAFEHYALEGGEELFITDTVIYVGWKQLTDGFLNLGYDVNRNTLSRTFVNVSGDWINPGGSLIPGTVMIRTLFGDSNVLTGPNEIPGKTVGITIYPNPVSEILHIETNGLAIKSLLIVDMSGRIVLRKEFVNSGLDVSSLSPGIYQVVLYDMNNVPIKRKILISR